LTLLSRRRQLRLIIQATISWRWQNSCERDIDENNYKIIQEVLEYHVKIEQHKQFVEKQEQGETGCKKNYQGSSIFKIEKVEVKSSINYFHNLVLI